MSNQFASIQSSGLLKDVYAPNRNVKGETALERSLKKRRKRFADTRLGIKDQMPRETDSDEITGL